MIYENYEQEGIMQKINIIFSTIKKKINLKTVIFVVLSLIMVNMNFMGDFLPFSYVIMGAASVFNIPLLIVLVSSVIGFIIASASISSIIKLLAFFTIFTFITALINIEGISRKYSVFFKFIISVIIVEMVANFLTSTLFIDFFNILNYILIISILYFIFTFGIFVLINFNKKYIYSKEETICMLTVVSLALTVIEEINVLSFSIYNILVFVMILIYGWKKGALSGCSAGLVVGLFLTAMTNVSMSFVVMLAFSGLIAGIFSKFGKVAVVVTFILGNVYIAYYSSGFSELTLRTSEILIASLSLLFIPKTLEMKLDYLFNKNNTLNKPYENVLDCAASAKNKIGAVSEVFESLANITIENTPEYSNETRSVIKKYIVDYVQNNCIDCVNRHNCIAEKELDITVDYIASKLENNETIEPKMLKYDCEASSKIIDDITEVYNSMKLMRLLKEKEHQNSIRLSNQYKEVSKILSNVARNVSDVKITENKLEQKLRDELKFYGYIVYEDELINENDTIEYVFITDILTDIDKQKKEIIDIISNILEKNMMIKLILNSSKKEKSKIKVVSMPKYEIKTSVWTASKSLEDVSGDSYLSMEIDGSKHLSVISDGSGSGKEAAKASQSVVNMLDKLLKGGFDQDKALEIMNSILKLKDEGTSFATLDVAIVDETTADSQYIKIGAAPTYILQNSKLITINNSTIPLGLIEKSDYIPITKKLEKGDIIIQISDGVVSDTIDRNANYFTKAIQLLDVNKNTKYLTDELAKAVLKENKNKLNDDVTIIVTKIQ